MMACCDGTEVGGGVRLVEEEEVPKVLTCV